MSTSTLNVPPPILEREDSVIIQDLICTLCHEIPLDPVLTPCDHVFCKACIESALSYQQICPNDRSPLSRHQLQPLNGMLRRIWEKVGVKCPQSECSWTGCVSNYTNHALYSHPNLPVTSEEDQNIIICEMEAEIARLTAVVDEKDVLLEKATQTLTERTTELAQLMETFHDQLVASLHDPLKRLNKLERLHKALDTSYAYDRSRVVDLTQFICRHLEHKPREVDINRLYNCIQNIHRDYVRGWADNPEHLRMDVKMLLSVCSATAEWFSDKQRTSINSWLHGL
jgi:hypothetical protein